MSWGSANTQTQPASLQNGEKRVSVVHKACSVWHSVMATQTDWDAEGADGGGGGQTCSLQSSCSVPGKSGACLLGMFVWPTRKDTWGGRYSGTREGCARAGRPPDWRAGQRTGLGRPTACEGTRVVLGHFLWGLNRLRLRKRYCKIKSSWFCAHWVGPLCRPEKREKAHGQPKARDSKKRQQCGSSYKSVVPILSNSKNRFLLHILSHIFFSCS